MAYPTPIVQIAFDDGPYVASPTWTDVTSYVRSMSINRGRSDDWGDLNGNATVVLNNRTRLFDPFYTSGTYYGKLLPRRQIRIRAETTELGVTTTHDVFRGFVDGFNPEWTDAGTDSTVTLSCFDALQLLAQEQLPADWSRAYILSTNPRHYWTLEEPVTNFSTNTFADSGSFPMTLNGTEFASNGMRLANGLPAQSVRGTQSSAANTVFNPPISTTDFTVAFWGEFDSWGSGISGYTGNTEWGIGTSVFTGQTGIGISFGTTARTYTLNAGETIGVVNHYAFTWNSGTSTLTVYINGQSVGYTLSTAAIPAFTNFEKYGVGTGSFQQFCVWTSILTQAQIRTIYDQSQALFPETSAARFTRILDQTSFPASLRSTASAPVTNCLGITPDGPQVTNELRITAATEAGPLFVSKNGTVTMFNQNQIFTNSTSITSQVTYGYGGTKLGEQARIVSNGDNLRNTAYINMSNLGVYKKTNSTSVTTYGTASTSIDTHAQTLANAQSVADITTGFGGIDYPDLQPFEVVLSSDGPWKPTLDLELFQRITVKVAPPTGNVITMPMLVQRIQHDVVPGLWTTTLEGSQRWASVFILGTSTLGGTDLLG